MRFPSNAVFLVSCVGQKLAQPAPARDLYTSDWFRKARAFVESHTSGPWGILSALHGLVPSTMELAPYDLTLSEYDRKSRIRWGIETAMSIRHVFPSSRPLVVLAGRQYRDLIVPFLKGYDVQVPMAGLGIGQQKSWLMASKAAA
jgi:hypothetical protein